MSHDLTRAAGRLFSANDKHAYEFRAVRCPLFGIISINRQNVTAAHNVISDFTTSGLNENESRHLNNNKNDNIKIKIIIKGKSPQGLDYISTGNLRIREFIHFLHHIFI